MKILFVMNGLTHYYNYVLSKLNSEPDVELTVVVPTCAGANIGEGVYQTREGINFKVIELEETRLFGIYSTFKGLADVLKQERPSIIVVIESYLHAFLFDVSVMYAKKRINTKLILKSIPFRHVPYQEARNAVIKSNVGFARLSPLINRILTTMGAVKLIRLGLLAINKYAYRLPDAHVNYVEAFDLWASYGITSEKVFITRNSPDTDLLLSVNDSLATALPILPHNPYRLIHVGRLIEWKRVDMLIRAFARTKNRYPEAELLVIGNGPEERKLKNLSDGLQVTESVIFTGGVYDPYVLGQYFKVSSLYVLAGMGGLSINEAMCFGLPVLCSVGDGTEKVLVQEGVNGRYFEDGNEDDLFEKLIWFFEHPELMSEMGRCSEQIIRNDVNIHTVLHGYMDAFRYVHEAE